jgi:excisionase family DNA binding protein
MGGDRVPLSHPRHTTDEAQELISVAQLARELAVSLTSSYGLLWSGEIPSLKIGSRRLVRRADLREFIERRLESNG